MNGTDWRSIRGRERRVCRRRRHRAGVRARARARRWTSGARWRGARRSSSGEETPRSRMRKNDAASDLAALVAAYRSSAVSRSSRHRTRETAYAFQTRTRTHRSRETDRLAFPLERVMRSRALSRPPPPAPVPRGTAPSSAAPGPRAGTTRVVVRALSQRAHRGHVRRDVPRARASAFRERERELDVFERAETAASSNRMTNRTTRTEKPTPRPPPRVAVREAIRAHRG